LNGGGDLDNRMVSYFADQFQKKFQSDLWRSPKALRALLTACERARRTFSTAATESIICDSLDEGHDFMDNISRAMFENLNNELFRSTMTPVAQVLREANMAKGDVTDIILVGGSLRFPRAQQLLHDFFNGKQPCRSVDPDEAVASGSAVQTTIIKSKALILSFRRTVCFLMLRRCRLELRRWVRSRWSLSRGTR
jgi:L1 cell adhesion molecule like protein